MRQSFLTVVLILCVAVSVQAQRRRSRCEREPPYEVYNLVELALKFVSSVARVVPAACDPRPAREVVWFRCKTSNDNRFYEVDFWTGKNVNRMNPDAKWAFVIHGFLGTCRKDWPIEMLGVLTDSEPMNVCCVDWSRWAGCNYVPDATMYVYAVGDYVAEVIRQMMSALRVNMNRIIVIGHSFGGIITGVIGKHFPNPKLPIGIALDPAGILYTRVVDVPPERRLARTDYQIVKTIITDEIGLGSGDPSGTVNVYANGGENQPHCDRDTFPCSHFAATTFFTESMRRGQNRIYPISNSADRSIRDYFTLYARDIPGNYNLTTSRCYPYASPRDAF